MRLEVARLTHSSANSTRTGQYREVCAMTRDLNLQELVQVIGPRFAEGAAERDEADAFAAEHY